MQAICGRVAEWQFVDICELIAKILGLFMHLIITHCLFNSATERPSPTLQCCLFA